MVTCHAVGGHALQFQGALALGVVINIDIDDVARVGHDACGVGESPEAVAHGEVAAVGHLRVIAVDVVVCHAEEPLIVGCVACRSVGVLLPGVVLHLQHHFLHGLAQSGIVGVCCQLLVGKSLNFSFQRAASLVLEQVVEVALIGGEVLHQFLVFLESAASVLDVLFTEFHFLECPDAGFGTGVPQHYVVALRAGSVQTHRTIACVGDYPLVLPFVRDATGI